MNEPTPEQAPAAPAPTTTRGEKKTEYIDESALFASPLPITGERKTTTRVELWASQSRVTKGRAQR